MNFYKAHFIIWKICFNCMLVFVALAVTSCNGTRFIFKSSDDIISTPDNVGLVYEDVLFTTKDNINLHAWLVPGDPRKPMVVFFHGNAANISYRVDILRFFNELGFSVFIFDYRGFGKSDGQATSEEDLYIDSRSALDYLRSKGWSASQMIYYGRSMGAAASLQMGLEFPPSVVVMEAPFTSMSEIAWHTAPITYALIGWWSIRAQFDNINKIEKLTTPVVLFQGDKDHIVPLDMAQRLYERANEPKTFYLVPGGGHSDLYQVGGEKYREIWLKLARHHLPLRGGAHFTDPQIKKTFYNSRKKMDKRLILKQKNVTIDNLLAVFYNCRIGLKNRVDIKCSDPHNPGLYLFK